jgi:hypothetical protein
MQDTSKHISSNKEVDSNISYDAMQKRRLKEAILLSDAEKFKRFTKMMRIGKMLENAVVTHKQLI